MILRVIMTKADILHDERGGKTTAFYLSEQLIGD